MKKKIIDEPKNVFKPMYTLFDLQMSVGDEEYSKGKKLYEGGRVKHLAAQYREFSAAVLGTHEYTVQVDATHIDRGNCTCYLGQQDILCKHMIAVAIAAVHVYRPEGANEVTTPLDGAVCSGEVREATEEELTQIQSDIRAALTHIKSYTGSSKTWFTYQDSLSKGARLVLYALSNLPVCKKSVDICMALIVKLDTKLATTGIDDSDGTVGDLIEQIIELLRMFESDNSILAPYIKEKFPKETNFEWKL